jgi:hypothetical protein
VPVADATGDPGDEIDGWRLSEMDYRLLRSIRIAAD